MTDPAEAKQALDAIRTARAGAPGEMKYPLWYDLLYGAVCALIVAGQGLPQPWSALAVVAGAGGLSAFIHGWRSRYGWWVNGYSPRRARWVAFAMAGVLILLIGLTLWAGRTGVWWAPLATGPAAFVAAIGGSRLWMRVWRRELAEAHG